MMARTDPYNGYHFALEIDGLVRAGFKACAGLDEGTPPRALPGLVTFTNVTLTRGVTADATLWDWHRQVLQGASPASLRKTVSIILWDDHGDPKIRWNLVNCWPTRWSGPSFDATSDAVAI